MRLLDGRNVFHAGVTARQPVIEHAACNWRGVLGAKAGVFNDQGQRDRWRLGWRKRHVQGVVTQSLIDAGGDVFFALLDLEYLGSAGLAGTGVGSASEARRRGALNVDAHQGIPDDGNILGLGHGLPHDLLGGWSWVASYYINHLAHQVWLHLDPVVGQGGGGRCQLQHGEVVVALANAQRDGLAGVPLLLVGSLVGASLPVG